MYNAGSLQTNDVVRELLLHVLSVPSLVYHMETLCNEMYIKFLSERIFTRCLSFLSSHNAIQAIAITLEGNRTLSLLG